MTTCSRPHCHRPARMAVRTHPDPMRSVVYYDLAMAPKAADVICRRHGTELMYSLINTLVPEDAQP